MKRRILDTSVLIRHWHQQRPRRLQDATRGDAVGWAEELIRLQDTNAIVTPVAIEFVAGSQSAHELMLARAYLNTFDCIDDGSFSADDLTEARRLAERLGRGGRPRQLGDCLVRAIARRLRYEIWTFDIGLRSLGSGG